MQKTLDWLRDAVNSLQYGTVVVTVTIHQGKVVSVEKQITETEKSNVPNHKVVVKTHKG